MGTVKETTMKSVLVEGDDFSRCDFTDELSIDNIKSAGFGGNYISAVLGATNTKRAVAVRIPGGFDTIRMKEKKTERTLQVIQNMGKGVGFSYVGGFSKEVNDDFAVAGSLEDVAIGFIFIPEQQGIDEITVMCDSDLSLGVFSHDRLGVFHAGGTGGGITHVPYGYGNRMRHLAKA